MRAGLFAALLAASPAASASETPLADCIRQYGRTDTANAVDVAQLGLIRHACFEIVADEQRVRRLSATARIYEGQIRQGEILLWMVVILTFSGVALAGLQLVGSYRLAVAGKGELAEGGEVTLSPTSAAVKSSALGVLILALSLGFFAIYVREVYTISQWAGPGVPAPGPPAATTSEDGNVPPPAGMVEVPR